MDGGKGDIANLKSQVRPGVAPLGPVRNHLRSIPFGTWLLAASYKQARHHKTDMVSTVFNIYIFYHQRPFRRKKSAMVGNFVHKVRSYRVLEAPDWPKLTRNAAISELCGSC